MTMPVLMRVPSPLAIEQVAQLIVDPATLTGEPTGDYADLADFRRQVDQLLVKDAILTAGSDAELAKVLHQSLIGVRRRTLLDPRTWHWLCLAEYADYTLARWADGADRDLAGTLEGAKLVRFLGQDSLVGRSRNALARLYWGADTAFSVSGDYTKVATVFEIPDLLVGVSERKMGLDPSAAIAIMEELKGLKEKARRKALKRVNFILSTTSLEALSPAQVVELLGLD
ncbi:hypothetical protein IMCC26207_110167 [Actinobacteria bacterium IMCC26207]|nr:hypothetical protein IMCC26207_110167 [Actinobacteria bacterium IMCC26207]